MDLRLRKLLPPRALPIGDSRAIVPVYKRELLLAIPYFAISLIVYLSTVKTTYGLLDDYELLAAAHKGQFGQIITTVLQGGRPVDAAYLWLFLAHAGTVAHLGIIREFGLVGFSLLATLLYVCLRNNGVVVSVALLLPTAVILLPSFQVYASWAMLAAAPFAAAAGGLASMLLDLQPRTSRRNYQTIALALLLLVAAIDLYQPPAMFFWTFAAVPLVVRRDRESLMRFAKKVPIMAAALLVDYLLSLGLPRLLYGRIPPDARTAIANNPIAKLWWFRIPIGEALNLWKLLPSTGLSIAVACCIIAMLGWSLLIKDVSKKLKIAIAAALFLALPLAYLPNLIVAEDWPSYRTQAPLTALVVVYLFIGVASLPYPRIRNIEFVAPAFVMVGVVVVAGVLASRNIRIEFTSLQSREWQYTLHEARIMRAKGLHSADVVASSWQGFAPVARYDEFGVPTSMASFAVVPLVYDAIYEVNHHLARHVRIRLVRRPGHQMGAQTFDYPSLAQPKRYGNG